MPCDAVRDAWDLARDLLQPCVEDIFMSESRRRKMRDRKVAVRHAQLQSLQLKHHLAESRGIGDSGSAPS